MSATCATPNSADPPRTFPKSARLLKRADFRRVYDLGTRIQSTSFSVFVLPGHDVPRVGLTTPRAIGKSVFRNRLKRRLREALRLELPAFRKPVDYVFHPRKGLAGTPMPALRGEVRKVMERCAKS